MPPPAPPSSLVDPIPAFATPDTVKDAFTQFVRSRGFSLHVAVSAKYVAGRHDIAYDVSGDISGPDRILSGTESIDGQKTQFGLAVVGGRVYAQHADASWEAIADPAGIASFAGSFLRLDNALILGDLGSSTPESGYRMRIAAGLSLTPVQFNDGSIGNPHDRMDRIEVAVDNSGIPLSAKYAVSIAGTSDGTAIVAQGEAKYTFSKVGVPVTVSAPVVTSGSTLPPPLMTLAPSPTVWRTYTSSTGRYSASFPGTPNETSETADNPNLGPILAHHISFVIGDGSCCVINDGTYPASYVQRVGTDGILVDAGTVEVTKVGGQLVGIVVVSDHGLEGKEFVIATPTTVYRFREFLIGDVGVELAVAGTLDQVGSALADEFLESLTVVGS